MNRWWFVLLRLIGDLVAVPLIVTLAYSAKFKIGWAFQRLFKLTIGPVYHSAQIEPYLSNLGIITAIWVGCYLVVGVYRPFRGPLAEIDEWVAVVKGTSAAVVSLMAFTFMYQSFPGSRFVMVYLWVFGLICNGGLHYMAFRIEMLYLSRSRHLRPTIVIGDSPAAIDCVERLVSLPVLGYRYIGSIESQPIDPVPYAIRDVYRSLGTYSAWKNILETHKPAVVMVIDQQQVNATAIREWCLEHQRVFMVSVRTDTVGEDIQFMSLDGIPMMEHTPYTPPYHHYVFKTMIDWILALIGLLVLSPLMLLIALAIKATSPSGPVLFAQDRVGKGGRVFKMYKFRTMIPHAERDSGPVMVDMAAETRYIAIGRFLRRTSLDELPQLFNVLKGEMAIVGPRPERPHFVAQFSERLPDFPLRHSVKVGITGWAQVNGRSQLTHQPEQKLRYDLYYISHWRLGLDFKIILKTIEWVLLSREAY